MPILKENKKKKENSKSRIQLFIISFVFHICVIWHSFGGRFRR